MTLVQFKCRRLPVLSNADCCPQYPSRAILVSYQKTLEDRLTFSTGKVHGELPKCRFCMSAIGWREVNGRWVPFTPKGQIHHCERMTQVHVPMVEPHNAICARCWKPIIWTRNEICSCLNPIYVHKREAGNLKAQYLSSEKQKDRIAKHRAREVYNCVVCDALAVPAGDSVICTADSSHVFPLNYYHLEIIPQ
jgi:hypothetical protein